MGLYVNAWGIVRWRRPGKKGFVALSGLGTMLAATLLRITLSAPQPERRLRIGFQNSPPYHFPDAEGRPSGPAVDLIRVAAQAEKIELEWTFAPQGPEEALRSGGRPLAADGGLAGAAPVSVHQCAVGPAFLRSRHSGCATDAGTDGSCGKDPGRDGPD